MTRGRLALLASLPILILAAGEIAGRRVESRPAETARGRLEASAVKVQAHLATIVETAATAAARARDHGPEAARDDLPSQMARHFEGAGVVRAGTFESWAGTPAEISAFGEPASARLAAGGIRTS